MMTNPEVLITTPEAARAKAKDIIKIILYTNNYNYIYIATHGEIYRYTGPDDHSGILTVVGVSDDKFSGHCTLFLISHSSSLPLT